MYVPRYVVIVGSGSELSPVWGLVATLVSDNILSIEPLETHFSDVSVKTHKKQSFHKMPLSFRMSSEDVGNFKIWMC